MGLGRSLKKAVGKAVNKITGGNDKLNKALGIALAPVTGGASLVAAKEASKQSGHKWGLGKSLKKAVGKAVNQVTGGNYALNQILGVAFAPVTGGASLIASKEASKQLIRKAEKKEAGIRAAEEAEERQKQQKEYADFEKKILGQRSQRIENAAQSRTDFTSYLEEDMDDTSMDPRSLKQDRLLAKKRRLIGFE